MDMEHGNNALVIGYDLSNGNMRKALIVMRYDEYGRMKVVNAFYDDDAIDIYSKLTSKKEEEKNE